MQIINNKKGLKNIFLYVHVIGKHFRLVVSDRFATRVVQECLQMSKLCIIQNPVAITLPH